MSLARHAKARDANEPEIVEALQAVGATVERLDTPFDLLVGYRGKDFKLEVKVPLGKKGGASASRLTVDQVVFQRTWRGAPLYVVRSSREALEAIGAKARNGRQASEDAPGRI